MQSNEFYTGFWTAILIQKNYSNRKTLDVLEIDFKRQTQEKHCLNFAST